MGKLINNTEFYNIKTKSKFNYVFKVIEPIILYLGIVLAVELVLVLISILLGIKENGIGFKIMENIEEPIIDLILIYVLYKIYKKESDNDYPTVSKSMKKNYLIIGALLVVLLAPIADYVVILLEKIFPHISDVYEETFITSDSVIHIQANAGTITNRKGL